MILSPAKLNISLNVNSLLDNGYHSISSYVFFLDLFEAGIVLKGSEVKSLRDGQGSIADSYAVDNNGELFLINSHIPLYRQSSYNNHNPKSDRKLLLNRKEINKLI